MTDSSVSSHVATIGYQFVLKYYTILGIQPSSLIYFYKEKSTFTVGFEDSKEDTVSGVENINRKIQSLDYQDCKIVLLSIDSQSSVQDGIVVLVQGSLSNKGGIPKRFVETFFLAAQAPSGYFVRNDILRYLKAPDETLYHSVPPKHHQDDIPLNKEMPNSLHHDLSSIGKENFTKVPFESLLDPSLLPPKNQPDPNGSSQTPTELESISQKNQPSLSESLAEAKLLLPSSSNQENSLSTTSKVDLTLANSKPVGKKKSPREKFNGKEKKTKRELYSKSPQSKTHVRKRTISNDDENSSVASAIADTATPEETVEKEKAKSKNPVHTETSKNSNILATSSTAAENPVSGASVNDPSSRLVSTFEHPMRTWASIAAEHRDSSEKHVEQLLSNGKSKPSDLKPTKEKQTGKVSALFDKEDADLQTRRKSETENGNELREGMHRDSRTIFVSNLPFTCTQEQL